MSLERKLFYAVDMCFESTGDDTEGGSMPVFVIVLATQAQRIYVCLYDLSAKTILNYFTI